jgi:predicted MPP superfamily phosphohydrolase
MFLTIFLSVWTGLHLYVFWRAASIPFVRHILPLKFLIPIAVVLYSTFLLPWFVDRAGTHVITRVLELIGVHWLGIIFLFFTCLLIADLVTGFGFFFRNHAPGLRGLALVGGVALSLIAFVQGLRPPVVSDYEVRMANLPVEADGLVIVGISDLHLGTIIGERWLRARVDQINALAPDMIVMLGDIVEGHGPAELDARVQSTMRRLVAPLGVWGVTGNHDRHGDVDATTRFFAEAGVRMLRNEWREVLPGLVVAGVDDRGYGRESGDRTSRLTQALADRPADAATILLSHRAEGTEQAAAADVGLMLAAHTHDGQIWPFNYVVGPMFPFMAGRYEVGTMPLIVCRGTGTWGPRMRLWAPAEILRVTLRMR